MAGAWPVHGVFGSSEEMDENKSRRLRPDSSRNVGAPRGASRLESVASSPSGKFGERCSIDRPIGFVARQITAEGVTSEKFAA